MKGKYLDLGGAIRFSKGGIVSKIIWKGGKAESTLFCLSKGTTLSEHASSREAHILVLKGKGVFYLGSKPVVMKPGVMISMPPKMKHSLKATANLAFLLLLA